MSWNEPGGGNNNPKDPWGGGDQGPPDLDEALKKLQDKLGGMFGGGGGSSSSGGRGISGRALFALFSLALVVWGLLGFYQVDEQERAVVLRFGKYSETVQPGGASPAVPSSKPPLASPAASAAWAARGQQRSRRGSI